MRKTTTTLLGIGIVLSLFVSACATSPLGRKQLLLMPANQMDAMGAQAFNELKAGTPAVQDASVQAYVRCIADTIVVHAKGKTGVSKWEVVVFKDDAVNAFALPGGKIGVYTGMMKVADNQNRLAAVIGHEVGHVIAQHGNERVSEAFVEQGAMAAVDALAKDSKHHGLLMGALGVGVQFGVQLPHSRTQESEADIIGLQLMAEAGFDPRESVQVWQNMKKVSGGSPPEFLSTHPSHETRIENLQSNMKDAISLYEKAKKSGRNPKCK